MVWRLDSNCHMWLIASARSDGENSEIHPDHQPRVDRRKKLLSEHGVGTIALTVK